MSSHSRARVCHLIVENNDKHRGADPRWKLGLYPPNNLVVPLPHIITWVEAHPPTPYRPTHTALF